VRHVQRRRLPDRVADLLRDLPKHRPGDVHVPGARTGRSPGLPSHDRVDHDVRDAEDQENGRGGVASVMETAAEKLQRGAVQAAVCFSQPRPS
jgi:hypothetical protein